MNTRSPIDDRLDYLDAVRAFALILGILFHTSLSFVPVFIGWAVMDISTSEAVLPFVFISHSFRMELFFLIAGFFSRMMFHRSGAKGFVNSRIQRIVIPFIIGWFLLRPLLVAGWIIGGDSMRGDANIVDGISQGFASLAELPSGLFVGTHLWFLYYLIIISASWLGLRVIANYFSSYYVLIKQSADSMTSRICHSNMAMLILALPSACCMWFMTSWNVDTPDKSLVPQWPVLALYSVFFIFGWLIHRQQQLLEKLSKMSAVKIVVGVVAIIAALLLTSFESDIVHPQYHWIKAAFMVSFSVMMWFLVIATLAICKRFFHHPSSLVRYLSDSSYWLYLIHLPIVIALQIAVAELPIHWLFKLIGVFIGTIVVSIVLYDLFIRSTFIGAILNGKRKQRIFG